MRRSHGARLSGQGCRCQRPPLRQQALSSLGRHGPDTVGGYRTGQEAQDGMVCGRLDQWERRCTQGAGYNRLVRSPATETLPPACCASCTAHMPQAGSEVGAHMLLPGQGAEAAGAGVPAEGHARLQRLCGPERDFAFCLSAAYMPYSTTHPSRAFAFVRLTCHSAQLPNSAAGSERRASHGREAARLSQGRPKQGDEQAQLPGGQTEQTLPCRRRELEPQGASRMQRKGGGNAQQARSRGRSG